MRTRLTPDVFQAALSHRFAFLSLILLCALGAPAPSLAAALEVAGLRIGENPDRTRIVLDLSRRPTAEEYLVFTLADPPRLVVDLFNANLHEGLPNPARYRPPILDVMAAQRSETWARLVFTLSRYVSHEDKVLDNRLVVDLTNLGEQAAAPAHGGRDSGATDYDEVGEADPQNLRDLVVVVDAGHGGRDPGAIGYNGAKEKDVVLSIARFLQQQLDATRGVRVVMTRTRDVHVPRAERREFARRQNPDLFVSIHADSFTNTRARGASVYAIPNSEEACLPAERHDYAARMGDQYDGSVPHLGDVLCGTSRDGNLVKSVEVGNLVLASLARETSLHKEAVERAAFTVLKTRTNFPSILIETSFISNPEDARQLVDRRHQRALASAISRGLLNYLRNNAPTGSYLYQLRRTGPIEYRVQSGDSLSRIAAAYGVSVAAIRSLNDLQSDNIHVGRVLHIPGGLKP